MHGVLMSRRILLVCLLALLLGLVVPAVASACTAVGVRLSDHPGYVQAVVDFTGGTITSGDVTSTDSAPFDGSAGVRISRAGVRTAAAPVSGFGLSVHVVQGTNRLQVQIKSVRGRFKYLAYTVMAGNQLTIDLWRSSPPSNAAAVRRGPGGCLTLDRWTVAAGAVSASGHAAGLFENQFQLKLRGTNGRVMVSRSVIVQAGQWSAQVGYQQPRWQLGTLEGVDLSAKDGALSCLVQVRATLPAAGAGAAAVYVANYGASSISQYDVGLDGALLPKSPATVEAGRDPEYMAVSPNGQNVYVTNFSSNTVSQYIVGSGGALKPISPAAVATGLGATGIAISPDGTSVYVASSHDSTISEYGVSSIGALVPKSPATIATGAGPKAVAVSPDGKSVYVANENASTISSYDVGAGGVLTPKSPATVATDTAPVSLAITPDGKSLYVAAYYGRRIDQYNVGQGGTLAAKASASVAITGNPGSVTVSPNGKNVYVTTFYRVRQYGVGPGGVLEPLSPVMVWAGPFPSSVAISSNEKNAYVSSLNGHAVSQFDVSSGGGLRAKTPLQVAAEGYPNDVVVLPGR
jgi:DNA-binding beta-propeller fold protein YncE